MSNILEKIEQSALRFLENITQEETHRLIVTEAIKLVKADFGSIYLASSGRLYKVFSSFPNSVEIRLRKNGFTYRALNENKPFVLDSKKILKAHPELEQFKIESVIYIPLSYREKTIGVLSIDSCRKKHFTKRELRVLKLFGSMATLAIRKAQLNEEKEKALEVRDLFISLASHELRTPLTTISGYIQLLHSKLSGGNNVESKWIEQLSYENLRLTNLVKELLDINRIKAGQFDYSLKECSLPEIISRVSHNFKFTHPEHQLIVKNDLTDKAETIIADYDKILQVLNNILDNAAKFSPAQSNIVLSIKNKKSYIILTIRDQGEGIHKQDLPKLFEGFYKGMNNSKTGMGLGLFLAKDIIERHHGSIKLASERNKGTSVVVKLPEAKYG